MIRAMLADVVCIRALLDAADARAVGDDAECLLSESTAVLAANVQHTFWESPVGMWPAPVLDSAARLAALVRARNGVMQEAMSAPEDQHSFLIDQVGWLGSVAFETASRLIDTLRAMQGSGAVGGDA